MATMIYTGAGNTANWSDPNNWKRGVAPGAADTARLEGGAASVVTAPVAVNSIMLLGPQSVTFNGRVQTYGVGACKGLMVCDGGIATFAAGSALVDGRVLQVGVNAVGTLVLGQFEFPLPTQPRRS